MDNKTYTFSLLKELEGGFVNDPDDSGGPTNHGISLRYYKSLKPDATIDDIRDMTYEEAKAIYDHEWWRRYPFDKIRSAKMCAKLFCCCVMMGCPNPMRLLQRAYNNICPPSEYKLAEDGNLGIMTCCSINRYGMEERIYNEFKALLLAHCDAIVHKHPKDIKFINGWKNRIKHEEPPHGPTNPN